MLLCGDDNDDDDDDDGGNDDDDDDDAGSVASEPSLPDILDRTQIGDGSVGLEQRRYPQRCSCFHRLVCKVFFHIIFSQTC